MLPTILVAVAALAGANPYQPETPALVIHVTHHSDLNAERLADALRKACAEPSMRCRIADRSKATTFLHVSVQSVWRRPVGTGEEWSSEGWAGDPAARQVLVGMVGIISQVMIPGSVDARDESVDRLGARLLAAVKGRLDERTGVVVIGRTDAR
jgi:hypothetical protein